MPPKRSYEDPESNYSPHVDNKGNGPLDPIFGQRQAFPVAASITNASQINWEEAYTDVEAYLSMVRVEAETKHQIMFSDTKKSKTGSRVSPVALDAVLYETDPVTSEGISIDPQSVIHAEWHQEFVARFSATRQAFSSAPLEPVNTILPTTFAGWRSLFFTTDPDMNCVRSLDHQTAIKLVIYATKWLNRSTNASLSRWVLALLVRVPEVLEASDTSYVRHLGLKALKLQGKETSFTAKLTHECVVSIVGDIFRQRDLLDGMERRSQEVIDGSRRG